MFKDQLDKPTRLLLESFGAGNHKPGSGSASALQAMLSAQMIRTVIELTNDPKHAKDYVQSLPRLLEIQREIDVVIYPLLEMLFLKDSEQFDRVILLRKERDSENDPLKKRDLVLKTQEALRKATDLPFKIAELCLKLADYSVFVFDNGFKSARGDSGVALNSAISATASCLCIIELNLSLLPADNWIVELRRNIEEVKKQYDKLREIGSRKLVFLTKKADEKYLFEQSFAEFCKGNLSASIKNISEIEDIVNRLHEFLWEHKARIWKKETLEDPLKILRPESVFKEILNYVYLYMDDLGHSILGGVPTDIAGIIDSKRKVVKISNKFSAETRNFTSAHELGHAILHQHKVLHRDRPLDGYSFVSRSREEVEADKFAVFFLLPGDMVREVFKGYFGIEKFVINEYTVFGINGGSIDAVKKRC